MELPRNLELKAVDSEHPDTVAVIYGPLVLFAVSEDVPRVTQRELLTAQRVSPEGSEWHVDTSDGHLRLMPFWAIANERYSAYSFTG